MALYTTTSRPTQWTKASARALSFVLLSSFILFSASFFSTNGRTAEGVRRRSCQHDRRSTLVLTRGRAAVCLHTITRSVFGGSMAGGG